MKAIQASIAMSLLLGVLVVQVESAAIQQPFVDAQGRLHFDGQVWVPQSAVPAVQAAENSLEALDDLDASLFSGSNSAGADTSKPSAQYTETISHSKWMSPALGEWWEYAAICITFVTISGLMSGLTVGLMSISALEVSVLQNDPEGDPEAKKAAEILAPIIRPDRHHLLLVTLLLVNAACLESLPLFLDAMVPEWAAILFSVAFVLVFGEIVPQALCSHNPLAIGAKLAPLVKFFLVIMYPLAWPIGKVLDRVLGEEGSHFLAGRSQLTALLGVVADEKILEESETRILKAMLNLKNKTVRDKMTDIKKIFCVNAEDSLGQAKLDQIVAHGHSRIPIYKGSPNNIRSVLLAKSLIGMAANPQFTFGELRKSHTRPAVWVSPETELMPLMDEFLAGKLHMAIVTNELVAVDEALRDNLDLPDSAHILGLITMEDVIEALLDVPIQDEFDARPASLSVAYPGSTGSRPSIMDSIDDFDGPRRVTFATAQGKQLDEWGDPVRSDEDRKLQKQSSSTSVSLIKHSDPASFELVKQLKISSPRLRAAIIVDPATLDSKVVDNLSRSARAASSVGAKSGILAVPSRNGATTFTALIDNAVSVSERRRSVVNKTLTAKQWKKRSVMVARPSMGQQGEGQNKSGLSIAKVESIELKEVATIR